MGTENLIRNFRDRPPLGYALYGAAGGPAVIMLHGTPGSRLKFRAADVPARALGLRVIAPDRRGYATSPPSGQQGLDGFSDDIEALADALGISRFALFGVSGGAPFAAIAAARLGDRITALALVSPLGPLEAPAARESLTLLHRLSFRALPRCPFALGLVWRTFRLGLLLAPSLTMRLSILTGPPADVAVMADPDTRERLANAFREGFRKGIDGAIQDMTAFARPWPTNLSAIVAPARIWLGTRDANVPAAAARLLATRTPNCELSLIEEAGHLWISHNYAEVLAWIAARSRDGHAQDGQSQPSHRRGKGA